MSDDRIRAAVRSADELAMTQLAFDQLKTAMVNELVGSEYTESVKREHLYHGLFALEEARKLLVKAVQAGNDARAIEQAAAEFAGKVDRG